MDIRAIHDAIRQGHWALTEHAIHQMAIRRIGTDEIKDVILNGEIIEEYPEDKYSPSCLIFGQTASAKKLHVVCSSPPLVRIITAYEPDSQEWVNFRRRKP